MMCRVIGKPISSARAPERIVDRVAIRRRTLGRNEIDDGAFVSLPGDTLQLLDRPLDIIHRDHGNSNETFRIVGAKLRQPVVEHRGAGTNHVVVSALDDQQHHGCVEDLGRDARLLLELDPHLEDKSGLLKTDLLGFFIGLPYFQNLTPGIEKRALSPEMLINDSRGVVTVTIEQGARP